MVETERGCGWRKIGGSYLVCDGFDMPCDALPIELSPCPCCSFEVHQARSMQPIHAGYLASLLKDHKCQEGFICGVCSFATEYYKIKAMSPKEREEKGLVLPEKFYLMFVSKEFYTPESFVAEARKQGISKRIAANSLPKGFRVGKDFVFLAHSEVKYAVFGNEPSVVVAPDGELCDGPRPVEFLYKTAIFYAFMPQRLELVLWKGTDPQMIADYEEAGYHVVLIERTEENIKRHGDGVPPPLPYGFKRSRPSKPTTFDALNQAAKESGKAAALKERKEKKDAKPTKRSRNNRTSREEIDSEDDAGASDPSHWTKGEL